MPSSARRVGAPGEQRRQLLRRGSAGCVGRAGAQGAQVHAQHGRQQRRADGAVGRLEHAAHRRREAVHGAQARVGQAQPAEEARQREGLAIVRRDRVAGARGGVRARSERAERRIPSRASASVSGLARTERNGSMSCESASRPLEASTGGGQPASRSGSTSATRGSMSGLRRLAFTPCSGEASTALLVTSEPVPAVVGMATNGSDGRVSGRPRPPPPGSRADRRRWRPAPRSPCPRRARCRRPTPTTRSQPAAPAAAVPSRASSTVGSPSTANECPAHARRGRAASATRRVARGALPVTSSGVPPSARAIAPTSADRPGAEEDARRRWRTRSQRRRSRHQPASSGKRVDVLPARARLGHQVGDGVAPARVVRRRLVRGRRLGACGRPRRARSASDPPVDCTTSKRAMPGSLRLSRAFAIDAARKASTASGFTCAWT